MAKPVVAQEFPYNLELEPGTYWWCSCGLSKTQPFCDGSHKGTDLNPVEIKITEKKRVSLCGCKHTQGQPLCDGSHNKL